jgi:phage terminase small subunit
MPEKRATQLNHKQERFCQEYLKDQNGTQAATRAGYSEKTANEQASRLLANVNIKARIAELMAPIAEAAGITLSEHLKSLKALRDRADAAEQYSAAITAEVSCGKASGLYVDKVEQKITVSIVSNILQTIDGKTAGLK